MSPMPPRMPATAIVFPSGENAGDSGSSTDFIAMRVSIFRVSTFWMMSVRSFSVRTRYASLSPLGDHAIHGIVFQRAPSSTRGVKP